MAPEKLDTSSVFERIFSTYRQQAGVLLPAAAVLYLLPAALGLSRSVTAQALALAATIIAGVWYQGMVVQAARDIQDGVRDLSVGGLFRAVSPVLAPLLWTAILFGVGVFIGFLAFIIPGLVLFTQWAVAAPAVVIEKRTAVQALGRSRRLVHGHGWQVFGVVVVTLLIVILVDADAGRRRRRDLQQQRRLRHREPGRRRAHGAGVRAGLGDPLSRAAHAERRAVAAVGRRYLTTRTATARVVAAPAHAIR